jgi:uncharacterized protein YdcH (DUF465 family)
VAVGKSFFGKWVLDGKVRSVIQTGGGGSMEMNMSEKQHLIERLSAEHRSLKGRIRALVKHKTLTSAEQVEYQQLKKMKLRTKDRMVLLQG